MMTRKKMIAKAKEVGLIVRELNGRTLIYRGLYGVAIYADGSIHRADIDLSLTLRMRVKEAASFLRIPD